MLLRLLQWLFGGLVALLKLQKLYDPCFRAFMSIVERDVVPDFIIRRGIRFLLSKRVDEVMHYPIS